MDPGTVQGERFTLPRGLIFCAAIWLVISWVSVIGLRPPVQPAADSFTPGVRMMMLLIAVGLCVGWPLLRLSQTASPWPVLQTALDMVVLAGMAQVVVWPLRLVTPWSPFRTAAIDAQLMAWMVLIGAVIASAVSRRGAGGRAFAMLACIVLTLAAPALAWLLAMTGVDATGVSRLSPYVGVVAIGQETGPYPDAAHWERTVIVGVAAVLAWTVAIVFAAPARAVVATGPETD